MSDYDDTLSRIRNMNRWHKSVAKEHEVETAKEAATLASRFVAAGWSYVWGGTYTSLYV